MVIAAGFGILATSASAESFAAVNTRYIVIYHANNGTSEPNVSDTSYSTTFTARAADTFSSPGILFYFDGWSLTEDGEVAYEAGEVFTVSQQVTNLYAVWKFRSFQFMTYTVTYHANNGLGEGDVTDGPYFAGASVTTRDEETYTAPAGTEFAGWSLTSSGTVEYYAGEVFIMPGADVNLYGVWTTKPVLNRTDHLAYMQGYPDGTFGPTRNMTRAEAVVMFSPFAHQTDGHQHSLYLHVHGCADRPLVFQCHRLYATAWRFVLYRDHIPPQRRHYEGGVCGSGRQL